MLTIFLTVNWLSGSLFLVISAIFLLSIISYLKVIISLKKLPLQERNNKDKEDISYKKFINFWASIVFGVVTLSFFFYHCVGSVPNGHTGIVSSYGKPKRAVTSGWHIIWPNEEIKSIKTTPMILEVALEATYVTGETGQLIKIGQKVKIPYRPNPEKVLALNKALGTENCDEFIINATKTALIKSMNTAGADYYKYTSTNRGDFDSLLFKEMHESLTNVLSISEISADELSDLFIIGYPTDRVVDLPVELAMVMSEIEAANLELTRLGIQQKLDSMKVNILELQGLGEGKKLGALLKNTGYPISKIEKLISAYAMLEAFKSGKLQSINYTQMLPIPLQSIPSQSEE